jgi:hypothetical protein
LQGALKSDHVAVQRRGHSLQGHGVGQQVHGLLRALDILTELMVQVQPQAGAGEHQHQGSVQKKDASDQRIGQQAVQRQWHVRSV